jgi:hypothetical protein
MESIDLRLAEEALGAIARRAIERKTGARGAAFTSVVGSRRAFLIIWPIQSSAGVSSRRAACTPISKPSRLKSSSIPRTLLST